MTILQLLTSLIILLYSKSFDLGKNSIKGQCYRHGRNYYLVISNLRYHFPDRYTIERYCDNGLGTISIMNDSLYSITKEGESIDSLWDHHSNENMNSIASNQSLILDDAKLLPFLNPSIMYLRKTKDWIISWRLPDQHSFRVIKVPGINKTAFSEGFNNDSTGMFMSMAPDFAAKYPEYAFIDLKGEDPRLFRTSQELVYVTYCKRFNTLPEIRMAHVQLFFNDMDDSKKIDIDDIIDISIEDQVEHFHDQKNWTPFEYNSVMYYINSIWPFQVVNITISSNSPWLATASIITNMAFHNIKSNWKYGHIRGGTPALMISNNTYLSFFHSSSTKQHLQTYVFGAFTFVAVSHTEFKLLSISHIPIASKSMYTGTWKEQMGAVAFIDYVTFPMSFFIEKEFVFLLYGWQDKEGHVLKLKLKDLLASLVEIK